ncbi:MAG: Crp/Fnr family transcriptional regulator [Marinifilaceae bacterium]|jgi:CRP-like cAMP-binding protein
MSYFKLFQRFQEQTTEKIEILDYKKGEIVIQQDGKPEYVYILLVGGIKVYHSNSKGQNFLFGIFEKDEIFGELEVQVQTPFFNSVCCIRDSKVARITHTTYKNWLKSDPEFALYVNKKLCTKIANSSWRMVEYNFFPLEYHVLKYLVDASDNLEALEFLFNKQDMTHYLGSNPRSINRILKQFSDEGMIEGNKNRMIILDKEMIRKRILSYL